MHCALCWILQPKAYQQTHFPRKMMQWSNRPSVFPIPRNRHNYIATLMLLLSHFENENKISSPFFSIKFSLLYIFTVSSLYGSIFYCMGCIEILTAVFETMDAHNIANALPYTLGQNFCSIHLTEAKRKKNKSKSSSEYSGKHTEIWKTCFVWLLTRFIHTNTIIIWIWQTHRWTGGIACASIRNVICT